ncbi:hypothetical protein NNJEOMEG_00772 [Fundidesulfovibrio magnetotacticus]|uniref:Glycosyltransferase n=1 Tax=Fundidesulfovibrio magnetotacticus TaxID=2730080 RepID=A0A6V8LML9_9BACT|nr:glycosyltransferase [Fundidesulfovibrio magnetotacticus]GFK92944.1 hypothetical protein NNJEOMEG_00772 [Fundidesulfovibrio magnetotacticus]
MSPFVLAAYSLDLPHYACARLRLLEPARALGGRVELRWAAASDGDNYAIDARAMEGAHAVLFQRLFPNARTWPLVEQALASGLPVLYEMDDHILDTPRDHPMREALERIAPHVRRLLSKADLTVTTTPELRRILAPLARRVAVVPNFLPEALWDAPAPARSGPVRVLYAGSPTHREDLELAVPALEQARRRHGDRVEFVFMGCAPRGFEGLALPFQDGYAPYARALREARPDIALAPLADNPFNRCKSAVKWLEYSAAGAAGIYADLPPYARVRHGVTGIKAGQDPAAWTSALESLLADPALRRSLAENAAREARNAWGLARGAALFLDAWQGARRERA